MMHENVNQSMHQVQMYRQEEDDNVCLKCTSSHVKIHVSTEMIDDDYYYYCGEPGEHKIVPVDEISGPQAKAFFPFPP